MLFTYRLTIYCPDAMSLVASVMVFMPGCTLNVRAGSLPMVGWTLMAVPWRALRRRVTVMSPPLALRPLIAAIGRRVLVTDAVALSLSAVTVRV